MDFDKMKQWMEVTQKYQNNKFWDMIFEQQSPPEEMMDEFENPQERKNSTHTFYEEISGNRYLYD